MQRSRSHRNPRTSASTQNIFNQVVQTLRLDIGEWKALALNDSVSLNNGPSGTAFQLHPISNTRFSLEPAYNGSRLEVGDTVVPPAFCGPGRQDACDTHPETKLKLV